MGESSNTMPTLNEETPEEKSARLALSESRKRSSDCNLLAPVQLSSKTPDKNADIALMTKEQLLAEFEKANAKRKKFIKFAIWGMVGYIALGVLLMLVNSKIQIFSMFGSLFGVSVGSFAISERQKQTALELTKHDDPAIVGVLCEILDYRDKSIRSSVVIALTRLLPKLKASDSNLLNGQQRHKLRSAFSHRKSRASYSNTMFQIATLKSYEQIGYREELITVNEIIGARTGAFSPEVVAAAKECLPYLQKRVKNETEGQTLLRASSFQSVSDEGLLRPAAGVGEIEPQELLRPSEISNLTRPEELLIASSKPGFEGGQPDET